MNDEYAQKILILIEIWREKRLSYAKEKYTEYTARIPLYFTASSWVFIKTLNRLYIFVIKEQFGSFRWDGMHAAEFDKDDIPSLSEINDEFNPKSEDVWLLLGLPKPIISLNFILSDNEDPQSLIKAIKAHAEAWVDEQVKIIAQEDSWIEAIRGLDSERKTQLYQEIHEAVTCHKMGLKIAAVSTACTALETACIVAIEKICGVSMDEFSGMLKKRIDKLYLADYLAYLEKEEVLSEKTVITAMATTMIRRSTAHSKTGEIKDYSASFALDTLKDVISEILKKF